MKDASLNPVLNGVRLPDGRIVAWAIAFPSVGAHLDPRSGEDFRQNRAERQHQAAYVLGQ